MAAKITISLHGRSKRSIESHPGGHRAQVHQDRSGYVLLVAARVAAGVS